ncbi:baculoviral IAP repeat-containing protein 5-like isoform X2 [Amphibalanus amphitrite]|nr:baculoviral IAP repeat-containing protein 5-like isoform X2 [Amphibalanus amphitrite]XP_043204975.1 baculoviral IAP repeat-containing protein 5-like isoform X2 [Amphibalanus amphitrite]
MLVEPTMNRLDGRLATFKEWLVENEPGCVCTARKMAESGFFRCGGDEEPDLTRCFVCHKEMEGWEAEDNPMEARYHTAKCPLAKLGKPASQLTVEDMLKLINFQQTERVRALSSDMIEEFKTDATEVRKQLEALAKKPTRKRRAR